MASIVSVLDSKKSHIGAHVVFGVVAVVYGLAIYYILPLAMLAFNFALILQIFIAILIGLLYGLALLAFNLQSTMERIMVYLFLFLERKSMRQMIFKNLTAHKMRNKMTAIIFSLAIGFIIFLVVMYRLQMKSVELMKLQKAGAYFRMYDSKRGLHSFPLLMDTVLERHRENITAFGYVTSPFVDDGGYGVSEAKGHDAAKSAEMDLQIAAVTPSVFDALIPDFVDLNFKTDSALSLGEQLYSKRGSQSGATGHHVLDELTYDPSDFKQFLLLKLKPFGPATRSRLFRRRVMWSANNIPAF